MLNQGRGYLFFTRVKAVLGPGWGTIEPKKGIIMGSCAGHSANGANAGPDTL